MNPLDASPDAGRLVSTSTRDLAEDPAWDGFLGGLGGAHHTQSAAWGRVKALDGWRPVRVVAEADGRVVGGAQVLVRAVPRLGAVGYLSRGPVLDPRCPAAAGPILAAVREVARGERLRAVVVEPDPFTSPPVDELLDAGLAPAHRRLSLGATVLVDVSQQPEQILAGMKSKCRYNVRLAAKRGITVRRGDEGDLPVFERLMQDTARRQGFTAAPASSYRRWFESLAPGHVELFVAEHEGEAVSALIAVAFGDTVVYKRGVWSGAHGDRRPNEAMHWAAMQWAHHSGHRRYDFDGIDTEPARRVLAGEPLPDKWANASVTRFKLSFGGEVVLLPESLALISNRLARRAYDTIGSRLASTKAARMALRRIRDVS